MKLSPNTQTQGRRKNISAFTLIEMMISVGIYLIIFIGTMVAIQIFALRIYTLAATKLSATGDARKALNHIRDDIRQAKTLQVGNLKTAGNPTTFTNISGSGLAQGSALQIYSTTNIGVPYTIYYLDTSGATNYLRGYMVDSNSVATTNTYVGYITNTIIFDAEDFQCNIVTNNLKNNQVYRLTMQFSQWEYPIAFIGTNQGINEYNYYQLRTRVCRRAID
jgi:type II secretory pathway pseudopilin PulG